MFDWNIFWGAVSAIAAAVAVIFAYGTVREAGKSRKTSNFLVLYERLVELQKDYAEHSSELNEKPRYREQLLNHLEVIATFYLSKEINQKLVDEVMKEYFIGEVLVLVPSIEAAHKIEPTAYSHILKLIQKWDFPHKERDFGNLLSKIY
jgi:hypothetical protein